MNYKILSKSIVTAVKVLDVVNIRVHDARKVTMERTATCPMLLYNYNHNCLCCIGIAMDFSIVCHDDCVSLAKLPGVR